MKLTKESRELKHVKLYKDLSVLLYKLKEAGVSKQYVIDTLNVFLDDDVKAIENKTF